MTSLTDNQGGAISALADKTEHHPIADAKKVVLLALASGGGYAEVDITQIATKNQFTVWTETSVSISAGTQATVLSANTARKYAFIGVKSGGPGYGKLGTTATATSAIVLNGRGAAYEVTKDNFWDGDISFFNDGSVALVIVAGEGT